MMWKKGFAALLSAVMLGTAAGTVTVSAGDEDFNFNGQDQRIAVVQDGDSKAHYNVDQAGQKFHYEEGMYGKEPGDFSQVIQLENIPRDDKANDAFAFHNGRIFINQDTPVRTIEFSVAAQGDYDAFGIICRPYYLSQGYSDNILKFHGDGRITVQNAEKGRYQKGQWQRVAFSTYQDGTVDIWVNGVPVAEKAKYSNAAGFNGYGWLRMAFFNPAKAEDLSIPEFRNAKLALDDYHEYAGAYQPAAEDSVEYSFTASSGFVTEKNEIFLPKGKTAEELLGALTQNGKMPKLYRDASLTETFTTGSLEIGNILLLVSANGKQLRYLSLVSPELPVGRDFDKADNGWGAQDNQEKLFSVEYRDGLYGKKTGDRSYVASGNIPAGKEAGDGRSIRFSMEMGAQALNETDWKVASKSVVTVEFSMAAEGDFGDVTLQGRPRFFNKLHPELNVDSKNRGIRAYLRVFPDGTVKLKDGAETAPFRLNPKEWFRVALTFYPESLTYDLYINGELVLEQDVISNGFVNAEEWEYRGMQWFSPSVNFEKGAVQMPREACMALDDFKLFMGKYDTDDRVVMVSGYKKDDNLGIMEIPGQLSVSDFAAGLSCGTAVPTLYTDHSFSEKMTDGYVQDGNLLMVTSPNGLVRKYYTLRTAGLTYDQRIRLYVDGAESDRLAPGILKAEISAKSSAQKSDGVLVLAVFRDNVLQEIVVDEKKQFTDSVNFSVTKDLSGQSLDGVTVKAMFWKDMESMTPYLSGRSYR